MGAALHLAHTGQATPEPKGEYGGGGGDGQSFVEYAQRIYQDDRADAKSRRLLLAFAYVVTMQPTSEPKELYRSIRKALGRDDRDRYVDTFRELIEHDVPRYIAPNEWPGGHEPWKRQCIGPRLRAFKGRPYNAHQMTPSQRVAQNKRDAEDDRNTMKICGAPGKHRVLEKLPDTGWYRWHWFCDRHRDHASRVQDQVKEQNAAAPEPIPNAGGLLPCYFDADWVAFYRHYTGERWEPPVYGVRADDWPVPGKEPVPQRARLRLVVSGHDLESE
ncbi:hypothetical protein [Streptomyces sp. 5-10]|uniref:hypothetical protein n=1 Tax=Streptomyces sp. 5-10 TaxID=878925 RepID=UPI00168A4234|nr:hypothetical protein [Streptomyces sp. 5-10]MBD3004732.1 hypothetical protein [Streptomyces sp. 5-10]